MESFESYNNYKSIIDAKITEEDLHAIFTRFPAYQNYTRENYNSIVTWQAQKYRPLVGLYLYRKNESAADFFCAKSHGKII